MGLRRQWTEVVAASVVALVAALAVTAVVTPVATAQTPALRITMFGDSVMLGARDALLAQFPGQQVSVDAVENRSLLGAIDGFRAAGPALGDIVVLDLGYNDGPDPAVFRERIDGAMSALGGVKHVIWLNQHDWGPGRAAMNAELSGAASRYPNLAVADWNAEVVAHPDDVYADSIHLTPTGQAAMAALVREHVDRYVASLTPTTTAPTSPATSTPTTTGEASASRAATPGASTDDDAARDLVEVAGGVVLVLVVGTAGAVAVRQRVRRRRARQRRASSSASSASGAVTGSRHANRSHT